MSSDFYSFDEDEPHEKKRGNLFLWTVFILLLAGTAFFCWLFSFYVFDHPEQPRSYAILQKLKKLDPPKRFELTQAPSGDFLSPQRLYAKYGAMEKLQLENENALLLRNYIKNYKETRAQVPYITGRFEIIETHELKATDLFPTGVVAVAVANDYSKVVLQHVFTTGPESVSAMKENLPPGLDMRLERSRDPAAVIHVERSDDGRMIFTVMPLTYGAWGVKGSIGSFSLEPPLAINLKAGLPIVRGAAYDEAIKRYAATRRTAPAAEPGSTPAPANEPELVRVETAAPGTKVPETGALPMLAVATPIPAATPRIAANLRVATPAPRAIATPTQLALNKPPATPAPVVPPPPAATPAVTSTGVPLKNFFTSQQTPMTTAETGNWRTYSRGQQPPGRTITPAEASAMADRGGEIAEHLYLRGDFVVTASNDNRAVLRAPAASGEANANGTGPARIIVEFPPSALPPPEGSTLSRDDSAGFEVRAVRRSQDGQINIYVREIVRG